MFSSSYQYQPHGYPVSSGSDNYNIFPLPEGSYAAPHEAYETMSLMPEKHTTNRTLSQKSSSPAHRESNPCGDCSRWWQWTGSFVLLVIGAITTLIYGVILVIRCVSALNMGSFSTFSGLAWYSGTWSYWTIVLIILIVVILAIIVACASCFGAVKSLQEFPKSILPPLLIASAALAFVLLLMALIGWIGNSWGAAGAIRASNGICQNPGAQCSATTRRLSAGEEFVEIESVALGYSLPAPQRRLATSWEAGESYLASFSSPSERCNLVTTLCVANANPDINGCWCSGATAAAPTSPPTPAPPPTLAPTLAPTQPSTVLTANADVGTDVLQCADNTAFAIGNEIEITGGGFSERNVIKKFGSIYLLTPLIHSYPADATLITVVAATTTTTTTIPLITADGTMSFTCVNATEAAIQNASTEALAQRFKVTASQVALTVIGGSPTPAPAGLLQGRALFELITAPRHLLASSTPWTVNFTLKLTTAQYQEVNQDIQTLTSQPSNMAPLEQILKVKLAAAGIPQATVNSSVKLTSVAVKIITPTTTTTTSPIPLVTADGAMSFTCANATEAAIQNASTETLAQRFKLAASQVALTVTGGSPTPALAGLLQGRALFELITVPRHLVASSTPWTVNFTLRLTTAQYQGVIQDIQTLTSQPSNMAPLEQILKVKLAAAGIPQATVNSSVKLTSVSVDIITTTTTTTAKTIRRLQGYARLQPSARLYTASVSSRRLSVDPAQRGSYCYDWDSGVSEWCFVSPSSSCIIKQQLNGLMQSSGPCGSQVDSRSVYIIEGESEYSSILRLTAIFGIIVSSMALCNLYLLNRPPKMPARSCFYKKTWAELDDTELTAARDLGFDKSAWDFDQDISIKHRSWEQLEPVQKRNAEFLGFNENSWNSQTKTRGLTGEIDVQARFQMAQEEIVKKVSDDTLEADMFKIYGLFQQAKYGDCNVPEPDETEVKKVQKYKAWMANKGMAIPIAMEEYIKYAESLPSTK